MATNAMAEAIQSAQAEIERLNALGEHAWFFSLMRPLCELAARAERERTGHFGRGVTRRFDADNVACADCQTVIRNGGSQQHSLLAEIQADMVRRNPSLAEPEWTIEDYRTPRNRR